MELSGDAAAPQLHTRDARVAAVLGAAIALALTPFTPPGVPIVAASAACLIGLRGRPRTGTEEATEEAR